MYQDPKIKISDALDIVNGNKSELALMLGISRSAVSNWKKEGKENLPVLQAYRLLMLHPEIIKKAA
jgi:predicted transcriptional regulator